MTNSTNVESNRDGVPRAGQLAIATCLGIHAPALALLTCKLTGNARPYGAVRKPQSQPATTNLGELLRQIATQRPDAIALTTTAGSVTYTQLLCAAEGIAARILSNSRYRCGDRVIVLLPNSVEYIAAFWGVHLAGGVVVPVPAQVESNMLREIVRATEAVQIIASIRVQNTRKDLFGLTTEAWELDSTPEAFPVAAIGQAKNSPDELAAIFFTAGSTGTPKGVMLSHGNLVANARSIQKYLRIKPDDRPLCVLPFHHAFGNSVLQSHLLSGAQLILDGSTSFPQTLVEALAKHECTSLSSVPDLFRLLLDRTALGSVSLPQLRYMAVAGGALPLELSRELQRRIAPAEFFVMYGQSEATARLAFVPPPELTEIEDGCIGQPIPAVSLEVVDDDGRVVQPGADGELRARGPNIMLGYWRDPAATNERIRGGWLYTGDLATVDTQGRFLLKGRRDALVKIAGFRVHPADLENFAVHRLAVRQAVAVACEAAGLGTRLALYVRVARSNESPDICEMVARCRAELPRHLVPEWIQIVDEFPLNAAMKIDRPLLSKLAAESIASRRNQA